MLYTGVFLVLHRINFQTSNEKVPAILIFVPDLIQRLLNYSFDSQKGKKSSTQSLLLISEENYVFCCLLQAIVFENATNNKGQENIS